MHTHSHTHPPHQSSALRSSIRGWGMSGSKELRLLGNLVAHSVHSSTYTLNSSRRVPLQHARFFSSRDSKDWTEIEETRLSESDPDWTPALFRIVERLQAPSCQVIMGQPAGGRGARG